MQWLCPTLSLKRPSSITAFSKFAVWHAGGVPFGLQAPCSECMACRERIYLLLRSGHSRYRKICPLRLFVRFSGNAAPWDASFHIRGTSSNDAARAWGASPNDAVRARDGACQPLLSHAQRDCGETSCRHVESFVMFSNGVPLSCRCVILNYRACHEGALVCAS